MLRVLGRTDDAISTGGLTVFPQLVETALASHPGVADCAVFGVPDERLGQRVVAAVVAADGSAPPTLAELRTHVGALLDPTAAPQGGAHRRRAAAARHRQGGPQAARRPLQRLS